MKLTLNFLSFVREYKSLKEIDSKFVLKLKQFENFNMIGYYEPIKPIV